MTTPNRGLPYVAFEGANDPSSVLDSILSANTYTAAGAITQKEGTVFLKAGSAAAMTLVAPTAGLPAAGGDDGRSLTIVSDDANAYTVTTPANGINGSKHVATWTAAEGNAIKLIAYNGAWLATMLNGVTLT